MTNFDNIGSAMLMVFQITTLEGWYSILMQIKSAFSGIFQILIIFYFVILIFIGNFIILNLMLAVITYKFNETQQEFEVNDIQHHTECLCNESIEFSKVKFSGHFQELSKLPKDQ